MLPTSLPSWPPTPPAGSPEPASPSTAAQNSDPSGIRSAQENTMKTPEQNKKLVLEAFDTLFNKRDYAAAEKFWSPNYIQRSAHIPPGRDGLFNLARPSPPALKYERGRIVAEAHFVIVHGKYSNTGLPVNWIIADIVRIE